MKKAAFVMEDSSEVALENVHNFLRRKWRPENFRTKSVSTGMAVGERKLCSCQVQTHFDLNRGRVLETFRLGT